MPVDHEYFRNTNAFQWVWYSYQDLADYEEHINEMRDITEYHASFIEPEIVSKVVAARKPEQPKSIGNSSDSEFNAIVAKMFGRDPGITGTNNDEQTKAGSVVGKINLYEEWQKTMKQTLSPYNYQYWLEYDLER